jgi:hypothetical protein
MRAAANACPFAQGSGSGATYCISWGLADSDDRSYPRCGQ